MANNYKFYIDGVQLPINPSSLSIKVGNKNDIVDLANGGEMTILKSPSLMEISFTVRLPQMGLSGTQSKLPYLNAGARTASYYIEKMRTLKTNKKPFQFVVTRYLPNGTPLFESNITTVLENFTTKEDATEGFDVILDISLKQYIEYKTKVLQNNDGNSNTNQRTEKDTDKTTYTVKSGDTLWALAKRFYGDGSKYTIIYNANKNVIESVAKQRGYASSSNGHWIFPGTELNIPKKE